MRTHTTKSEEALYYIHDALERALTPYVLLNKLADHAYHTQDDDYEGPIDIGILRKDYTQFTHATLKTFLPGASFLEDKVLLSYNDIPIKVIIIDRKYKVFKQPDQIFFKLEKFNIANPFADYWKIRKFIT